MKNVAGVALGHIKSHGVTDAKTAHALLVDRNVNIVSVCALEASSKRKMDSMKGFAVKVVAKMSHELSV